MPLSGLTQTPPLSRLTLSGLILSALTLSGLARTAAANAQRPPTTTTNLWVLLCAEDDGSSQELVPAFVICRIVEQHVLGHLATIPLHLKSNILAERADVSRRRPICTGWLFLVARRRWTLPPGRAFFRIGPIPIKWRLGPIDHLFAQATILRLKLPIGRTFFFAG